MLCGLIPPSSGRCLVFGSDRQEEVGASVSWGINDEMGGMTVNE